MILADLIAFKAIAMKLIRMLFLLWIVLYSFLMLRRLLFSVSFSFLGGLLGMLVLRSNWWCFDCSHFSVEQLMEYSEMQQGGRGAIWDLCKWICF